MPTRCKRATGFHISDHALHAVCLTRSRQLIQLENTVSLELHHGVDSVMLGGEAGRSSIASALGEARTSLRGEVGQGAVALGHGAYFLKVRRLLHLNAASRRQRRENADQLVWEAKQFLADESRLYVVDAVSVGERGFVVAARHAVLELYASVFAAVDLPEPDYDIEPFALYNVAEAAGVTARDGLVVLVRVSASGADLLLVRDGNLVDVLYCARESDATAELVDWVAERVSAAQALGELDHAEPAGLWVAGDGAPALCLRLKDRMACPCAVLPWRRAVGLDEGFEDASLAVAAGLALRGLAG